MSQEATLLGLVQHYSPTGQEGAAVQFLVRRMSDLGYTHSFIDAAGNAVGIQGDGERQIVLLGHIDTVPGEIPVRLDEASGLLYGRGSVDAKGPLAAFVDAAAVVGALPGWQMVVIGAVDEEGDSQGARSLIDHYHPEFAIIGEPSRWERITLGYKGSAWAEITCRRPLGHTAALHESASEAAFAAWSRLVHQVQELNAGRTRNFDQVQLTLRGISSGSDGFEEWACLQAGARLPLDHSPSAWYDTLSRLLPDAQLRPTGYAVPAYLGEKNSPLVRVFLSSIRQAGGDPTFVLKSGTADLNLVAPAWNCPALAYGPGDSALDHTPNEHISLEEYHLSVAVLQGVLTRLANRHAAGKLGIAPA